jgi:cytochrome c-type biogenesis protein CcmE
MPRKLSPKILIAVGMLVAGFAVLFGVGLRGSLVYYLTVGEFLDQGPRADLGENFRINGNVVEGSIERPPSGLGASFLMTDGEHELRVSYDRETPDTFVDGSEVVVEGSLGPNGVFVARTLLAKCPSKYEASNTEADYKMGGYENREGAPQGDAPQPAAPR